jgi:pyrroline-5-carboxylate reductase
MSSRAPFFVAPSFLFCRPEPLFCRPEPPFLSPRAKRGVPRRLRASGNTVGNVTPRRKPRGLLLTTSENPTVLQKKTTVILSVKPQVMEGVLAEIKDSVTPNHLLISIAAGLPIKFYEKRLPEGTRLIRVMPNTCAIVGKAVSVISKGSFALEEDLELVKRLFSTVGLALTSEERYMDAVTALSGSGPAYVALFIEALTDAGVLVGLPRDLAETLALETVRGTVELMSQTKKSPYEVKSMVSSPGGTTIAALEALYEKGFLGIMMSAIKKAYLRSLELKVE